MRLRIATIVSAAVLVPVLPGAAAGAQVRSKAPRLTGAGCVPTKARACRHGVRVPVGKQVQLRGRRLRRGMRVTFRWSKGALATRLARNRAGWTARVPAGTAAGRVAVTVRDRAGRRSNARHIVVVSGASLPPLTAARPGALPAIFAGDGMWIWYVSKSEHGDLDAIALRAQAAGLRTVFVKSADRANVWEQFSPQLVTDLHARGLRVCAWQFVYGSDPLGEAAAAAASVAAGADCFVIDAETAYEGHYAAAQRYMTALRLAVGLAYPIGLTSFPYVDYHPRLPYSVFLGPGGAQANLPQVYWKAIGGSVDAVSAKTVANNRIYGAPIAPLGQSYGAPSPADLRRFRAVWAGYGAAGLSWWSWQASSDAGWAALSEPAPAPVVLPDPGWPALDRGSSGDQVIWMQQHLAAADPSIALDGRFSAATEAALRAFQSARGLPPTGETDAATWQALLALPLRPVDWTAAP
jgi:hypothetical protein